MSRLSSSKTNLSQHPIKISLFDILNLLGYYSSKFTVSNPHIAEKGKQSLIHTNMFWNWSPPPPFKILDLPLLDMMCRGM